MISKRLKRIIRKVKSLPSVIDGSGIVSYSQFGEDIIIYKMLERYGVTDITYLDIGANDPKRGSNTYFFYSRGYSGVLIEPNSALCDKISAARPRDTCLNLGIGDGDVAEADYYMFAPENCAMNTFSKAEAEHYEKEGFAIQKVIKLPLKDINDIIRTYNISAPTILSIDVEGLDEQILAKMDYNLCHPLIICVESVVFSRTGEFKKRTDLINMIESKGYFIYADTNVNTIFCSRRALDMLVGN
jgi:FkbM family methyltransferase